MIWSISNDTFYSMSWLKRQLKRLGLKRRSPDPPDETVKTLIEVGYLATLYKGQQTFDLTVNLYTV